MIDNKSCPKWVLSSYMCKGNNKSIKYSEQYINRSLSVRPLSLSLSLFTSHPLYGTPSIAKCPLCRIPSISKSLYTEILLCQNPSLPYSHHTGIPLYRTPTIPESLFTGHHLYRNPSLPDPTLYRNPSLSETIYT